MNCSEEELRGVLEDVLLQLQMSDGLTGTDEALTADQARQLNAFVIDNSKQIVALKAILR
jgi:hypothetical protein